MPLQEKDQKSRDKLGRVARFSKSPSYKCNMNSESPGTVGQMKGSGGERQKILQRRKDGTTLNSVTATNMFLKSNFSRKRLIAVGGEAGWGNGRRKGKGLLVKEHV